MIRYRGTKSSQGGGVRHTRAQSVFEALGPAAWAGDDVSLKLRARISMADKTGGGDAAFVESVADQILTDLFHHVDHGKQCPLSKAAQSMWRNLIQAGITGAGVYANDPKNHEGRTI